MALWGNTNVASNGAVYSTSQVNLTTNTANKTALFSNNTVGAFIPKEAIGLFGVTKTAIANVAAEQHYAAHAGWNLRTQGTGHIRLITPTVGGTGYSNTNLVTVTAPVANGSVNAAATITTNSTGGIISVTISNPGAGYTSKTQTAIITDASGNSAAVVGTGATLVVTTGGRAGRVSYETLVALNMTS